ncbi:MAG: signal recognition particle receptor subunit alpha, partial [Acetatifactor sp.]|nr:signal recognition particle receptor subunit alpha [Acetatifactor sp.]
MSDEKKGFFSRLKEGLSKTRNNIVRGIDNVFSGFSAIDEDFYEELEEILIMGDIGVNATGEIVERLKRQVKEQHIKEPAA